MDHRAEEAGIIKNKVSVCLQSGVVIHIDWGAGIRFIHLHQAAQSVRASTALIAGSSSVLMVQSPLTAIVVGNVISHRANAAILFCGLGDPAQRIV